MVSKGQVLRMVLREGRANILSGTVIGFAGVSPYPGLCHH